MKKIILAIILLTIFATSCKKEKKAATETTTEIQIDKQQKDFDQLLTDYAEGKFVLNPIEATYAGDNRFNDQFPNTLSDAYVLKKTDFYTSYKEKLTQFKDEVLTESQQMSKAVLDWDCDMALAQNSLKMSC